MGSASASVTTPSSMDAASKLYGGIDPKLLGLDPKTAAAYGLDPKMFSGGIDPKMFGLDPKLFAGLDAKTLAAYGIDPKFVQDSGSSSSGQKSDKKSSAERAASAAA